MDQTQRSRSNHLKSNVFPFLAVIILITAVSGVLGPELTRKKPENPHEKAVQEMERIAEAFRSYKADLHQWPYPGKKNPKAHGQVCAWITSYSCLFKRQTSSIEWCGPYIQDREVKSMSGELINEALVDPWGHGYQIYRVPPHFVPGLPNGFISVVSTGPDGVLDTNLPSIAFGYREGDDLVVTISRDA